MKQVFFLTLILSGLFLAPVKAQQKQIVKESPATTLTDWLNLQCQLVRKVKGIQHVAYSRHFAYAALAAYESIVNSDPAYQSISGQLNGLASLPKAPAKGIFSPASLNAAYADILRYFYSSFGTSEISIDSLEQAHKQEWIRQGKSLNTIEKSSEFGKNIAVNILSWAKTDGSESDKNYTPNSTEGLWAPAAPAYVVSAPFWFEKRSLTNNLFSVYALKQPVYSADTSANFYKMVREVYDVTSNLTPEQKAIALFWDDSPNGKYMTVFGHWTSILSQLISSQKLPLMKASEAYLKMALAMHEASILAWKGKFQYNVVRPITYIRQYINKDWSPLIGTPPHPEFPAAHATLSNAAATALCTVFGKSCAVTDKSYIDIGMKQRSFASLQDMAHEAGMSRLYGGIHYRNSIEQGFILGEAAALHVVNSLQFHRANQLQAKR